MSEKSKKAVQEDDECDTIQVKIDDILSIHRGLNKSFVIQHAIDNLLKDLTGQHQCAVSEDVLDGMSDIVFRIGEDVGAVYKYYLKIQDLDKEIKKTEGKEQPKPVEEAEKSPSLVSLADILDDCKHQLEFFIISFAQVDPKHGLSFTQHSIDGLITIIRGIEKDIKYVSEEMIKGVANNR